VRAQLFAIVGVLALLADGSVFAQGKSDNAPGQSKGTGAANGSGKNTSSGGKSTGAGSQNARNSSGTPVTPNQSTLLLPATSGIGPAAVTPFAWIDNARVMNAGTAWLGLSVVRWQGNGLSEVSLPVIDGAVGLSSRLQLGITMPHVLASGEPVGPPGGLGTSFVHTKVVVLQGAASRFQVAISPTLEILSLAAVNGAAVGQARTQWGFPVSADIDRGSVRLFGSTGYFSPGVWFGGAGVGTLVKNRVGLSVSLGRSWLSAAADTVLPASHRNEVSAAASMDLTPHIGVFGSLGRTIATSPDNGAGSTISIGMSVTASRPPK
jgi:hypothetical protein